MCADVAVRCSILAVVLIATAAAGVQEPLVTNGIGMELVLIHPGPMTVGRFQPPYPKPPGTT
jgi:sulfatase modifying factor 1